MPRLLVRTVSGLLRLHTPDPTPPSAAVQILPDTVAAALAKAQANTAEWQAFKAQLDSGMTTLAHGDYQAHGMVNAAALALGYLAVKDSNPSLAADYAGKALAYMKCGFRQLQSGTGGSTHAWTYIGRGDGATTDFTLPQTPIAGTVQAWLSPRTVITMTRSSIYDLDWQDSETYYDLFFERISNSSDGSADYALGTDWNHGANAPNNYVDWRNAANKPANGATYYITSFRWPLHEGDVILSSSGFTVTGTTISFNTPPALNQGVFVRFLYHEPGGLRYQQTEVGQGGGLASIFVDSGYTARTLAYMAIAYDWLYDFAGFTNDLKTEFADRLVSWIAIEDSGGTTINGTPILLWMPTTATSNYGVGHYALRVLTGLALEGRHASAEAIKAGALDWRTNYLLPKLQTPTDRVTLQDGDWIEGITYAALSEQELARETIALNEAGWVADISAERQWAAEAIRSLFHRQPARAYIYSAGDGPTNPQGVPSNDLFAGLAALATDTRAKGYANWQIQTGGLANSAGYYNFLFRDPAAATSVPGDFEPLAKFHRGTGLFVSRAAWDYASTWVAVDGSKNPGGVHSPYTWGGVQLWRGSDILLADANAWMGVYDTIARYFYGSTVICDDNKDGLIDARWLPGSTTQGTPGVVTASDVADSGYAWFSVDFKSVYSKEITPGTGGMMNELEREVFHVRPDVVIVLDRVETSQAAHPKQLRWYIQNRVQTATGGTFTLTHAGNTTAPIPFDADGATLRAALEALPSIGAGNVVASISSDCGGLPDLPRGHYRVDFSQGALAGTTQPLLTGDGSGLTTEGGGPGLVRVQDHWPEGSSGNRLVQRFWLGEVIPDDSFLVTSGSSRLFGQIYADADLITDIETTSGAGDSGATQARRIVARPASDTASIRFATALQTAPSSTQAMDASEFILGANAMLFGVRLGQTIALARYPKTGFALPETYTYTAPGGGLTHYISGLTANTDYQLSGSASGTVTSSAAGVLTFTTTGTGGQSVTIGSPTGPNAPTNLAAVSIADSQINLTWTNNAGGSAWFVVERSPDGSSWTPIITTAAGATSAASTGLAASTLYQYRVKAVNNVGSSSYAGPVSATTQASVNGTFSRTLDGVGISADLDSWYADEQARQGNASPIWGLWHCALSGWANPDYPGIIAAHHDQPGCRFYRNLYPDNGGTLTFTNVTTTELGANSWQLGQCGGNVLSYDIDGDGQVDHGCKTGGGSQSLFRIVGGTLVNQGFGINDGSNYIYTLGDFDGDGDVDVRVRAWPFHTSLTALSDTNVLTYSWNGTSYTRTSQPYSLPSGVPASIAADILDRIQHPPNPDSEGLVMEFLADIDGDGLDELILAGYFGYYSSNDFAYYLHDNGDGTWSDYGATIGLPLMGTFMPLTPAQLSIPRMLTWYPHLHTSIDGTGAMHLFIAKANSSNGGMYRWNGSSYSKVAGSLTNLLSGSTGGDAYMPQLYALDLTNSLRLDLIYRIPRNQTTFLLLNNGSGVFTQHNGPGSFSGFPGWDPYGTAVGDLTNSGKLDVVQGGCNSTAGEGTTYKLAVIRNRTSNAGRYLKVKLRRSTTANPFGVGGKVSVYAPGTQTLLREWAALPDGLPIHFGLGSYQKVDVKVTWPDGATSIQSNVSTNQTITVTS